jgi:hypothetical protein
MVLFSLGCAAKTSTGETEFGHHSGYPMLPYQILGIMCVVFAGFLFFSSLIMPQLYSAFQKPNSPVLNKVATAHAEPKQGTTEAIAKEPAAAPAKPAEDDEVDAEFLEIVQA